MLVRTFDSVRISRIRIGNQLKCWNPNRINWFRIRDPEYRYLFTSSVQSLDPQISTYLYVPVPTHLVSAEAGSADTGTYSPRQGSAWICRYLHTCRYWYLVTSSVQSLDPQIPTHQCCGSGSACFWASWIQILLSSCKNSKKTLDSYYFVTLFDFLSLKNDVNVPSKSNN